MKYDLRKPQHRDPPHPLPNPSHTPVAGTLRGTEETAHLRLKRWGLKFTAGMRKCMGWTPGGASPFFCPCSDLTSSLEMLGKSCGFQSRRHSRPSTWPLPLPWASFLHLPEQLTPVCLSYALTYQSSFEQGLPCEAKTKLDSI